MAVEGKKCIEKMTNHCRPKENLIQMFNCFDNAVLEKSRQIIEEAGASGFQNQSLETGIFENADDDDDSDDPY